MLAGIGWLGGNDLVGVPLAAPGDAGGGTICHPELVEGW